MDYECYECGTVTGHAFFITKVVPKDGAVPICRDCYNVVYKDKEAKLKKFESEINRIASECVCSVAEDYECPMKKLCG